MGCQSERCIQSAANIRNLADFFHSVLFRLPIIIYSVAMEVSVCAKTLFSYILGSENEKNSSVSTIG